MNNEVHTKFMTRAIELSRLGPDNQHGGPFGAVVVLGDEIIGEGFNMVTSTNDPSAHAEIVAIRAACKELNSFQLTNCVIYTSCEPCPMCLGAIYWARPQKVVYANTRYEAAEAGFDDEFIYNEILIDPASRKIPMVHHPNQMALAVFTDWKANPEKLVY